MTAHDLKPCPFCGGEARIETVNHDYGVTYSVGCFGSGRCGASFTLFDHRNDAIATWNRRTLSTITPAEVGGLVERLQERATVMEHLSPDFASVCREAASLIQSQAARIAELEADSLYVVWSHEHSCWWRANSRGYARRVEDAGLYSREGAIRISHRGRDGWHPDEMPDELPIRVRDLPKFAQDALLNKDASHA